MVFVRVSEGLQGQKDLISTDARSKALNPKSRTKPKSQSGNELDRPRSTFPTRRQKKFKNDGRLCFPGREALLSRSDLHPDLQPELSEGGIPGRSEG